MFSVSDQTMFLVLVIISVSAITLESAKVSSRVNFLVCDLPVADLELQAKRQSLAYRFADGIDLIVPEVRETFSCDNREYGYYADIDNNCQVFHVCVPPGQQFSFFCPNTTIFDQKLLVCQDELFATPCLEADRYYIINQNFGVTDPDKLVQL